MEQKRSATQTDKLQKESQWASITLLILSISTLSGILLSFPLAFSYWFQLNIISHTLSSSVAFLPLCFYCWIHFKRTLGIRNPSLIFSGLIACALFLVLFFSGFWLALEGHQENNAWVGLLHGIIAYSTLTIIAWHIISHLLARQQKQSSSFITFNNSIAKKTGYTIVIYGITLIALSLFYSHAYVDNTQIEKPDYVYDYGPHPFRPSQTETVSGGFIKTEQIAKSQQCGSCHEEIYQQWLSSTHRQAASDPAYVKNINLLESKRGITATRYCEGCHAPVALLTGELTLGGEHGGVPNTPAHNEGVGCLGCHGINNVVHLNGTASYEFDPKEYYLFDSSTQLIPQKIRNFLIRLDPSQHKQAMGSSLMQDSALCATCHGQFIDEPMNNWGWVKMQSEYTHWLASPFSGQNEQNFQSDETMTCQNCHFPLVAGHDPSANNDGLIHSHRSLGANTVLPTLNGDTEQLEATKRFLQTAKVLVDIEEPHRADTVQSHQFVHQQLRPDNQDNTPFFLYLGETAQLRVTVTNRAVGHNFPAGTTDINQAWLYFKVSDADNQFVYESGYLNDDLSLESNAHTYHSIPVDRQGKRVWKHDLFRMTGDAYKNVIAAGKSDINTYEFIVPAWAKEPLTAIAVVKYRKFNQRYAKWALEHPKPILPIVDMARDSLTIPLRVKPIAQ